MRMRSEGSRITSVTTENGQSITAPAPYANLSPGLFFKLGSAIVNGGSPLTPITQKASASNFVAGKTWTDSAALSERTITVAQLLIASMHETERTNLIGSSISMANVEAQATLPARASVGRRVGV